MQNNKVNRQTKQMYQSGLIDEDTIHIKNHVADPSLFIPLILCYRYMPNHVYKRHTTHGLTLHITQHYGWQHLYILYQVVL